MQAEDALYGFVAFITSRKTEVAVGSSHNCVPIMDALKLFFEANNLDDPSPEFPKSFVMPRES